MILTVTLNPAIDKTLQVENFALDQVNRVCNMRKDAGGKGINVSHTIKALGRESKAFAVIGGQAGEFIRLSMEKDSIDFECLKVEGETRTNTKIVDLVNDKHTDINETGPSINWEFEKKIKSHITGLVKKGDVVVLSGSMLPGMDKGFYYEMVQLAKAAGASVILDADGDRMIRALEAGPDVIKPNIHELEGIAKVPLDSTESVIGFCRTLIEKGYIKKGILVSLGEDGALWITAESVLKADAIKTEVKSTVGAGDAMVAALAIALSEDMTPDTMLKLATAAAVARISTDGPIQSSTDKIEEIMSRVVVRNVQ